MAGRGELPELVRLSDGRTEPFEPERITRALFAAAERVGRADAFLARELTEAVLHFLVAEGEGEPTTPERVAEVVTKVVRELGHSDLARAYELRRPEGPGPKPGHEPALRPGWFDPMLSSVELVRAAATDPLERFSRTQVFPPDLASAHAEGLIRLSTLHYPLELSGITVPVPPGDVFGAVWSARQTAGELLAIDGPEYHLAAESGSPTKLAEQFVRDLWVATHAFGIPVILNLNTATPPPRLATASGPLFERDSGRDFGRRREAARRLAELADEPGLMVFWHVTPNETDQDDLPAVVQAAIAGRWWNEFVIDRPRAPICLGPGIDRQTPATLIQVGINLNRLVEMMGGPPVDPELLLRKVGSLARFAKTAGHVKQDFLRWYGRPALREAFLLERARLVLVPLGLPEAARATDRPPPDFAREIVKTIRTAAETDRPRSLPVRVDSPLWGPESLSTTGPDTPVRQQVKLASPLHAASGAGRLDVTPPPGESHTVDSAIDVLRLAAGSSVSRVRFVKGRPATNELI